MCVTRKVLERFPGSRKVSLALVDIKGPGGRGVCFGNTAGDGKDMSQVEQGIGVLAKQVRLRGKRDRRGCEFHGFGVAAVQASIPLNLVQRWMGHAQLSTTAIYAEAVGKEERDIAARMWR